jgi:hypothetical protein
MHHCQEEEVSERDNGEEGEGTLLDKGCGH